MFCYQVRVAHAVKLGLNSKLTSGQLALAWRDEGQRSKLQVPGAPNSMPDPIHNPLGRYLVHP